MTHLAFVFPGQGSQFVGMAKALAETSPAAAAVFHTADEALGEPISRLAWEGPEEDLNRTENSQPALLAASVAYLAAVRERWAELEIDVPDPAFAAGHSMGQYTALVAAGALGLADAVRLVRTRGQLMQASGAGREGRMAAIIGLDDAHLPGLVAQASAHGIFGIANRNSPGQVVVSGERAAVEASLAIAKALGARRAIELPVSVAAHSPLMADADAALITTADACRAELVNHLTTGVDWVGAIRTMRAKGITTFIEIGPGQVLTGLIKRIVDDAVVLALDDKSAADRLAIPFADASPVDVNPA